MAADRAVTPLPGSGAFVGVRLCAEMAEWLRPCPAPGAKAARAAFLEVAADHTARRLRSSAAGTWLTVEQAAEVLHVSPSYVRRLLRLGELDGDRNAGTWRVSRASAERRAREGSKRAKAS